MARTRTYYPFDIGIEYLLTASDDDMDFDFDLFMENLWKEVTSDITDSETDAAAGNEQPRLDWCTRTHSHHNLRSHHNHSTGTGGTLDDSEVEKFVDDQKNKNTKQKTNSDFNKWYKWCEEHGEMRALEDLPPHELNRLLGHFCPQGRWLHL